MWRPRSEMFNAVYYFESDSLALALHGDGNSMGFEEIIRRYGYTRAGNLARLYAGTAYLKEGRYDSAIQHLKAFGSKDLIIQARAFMLIGDAYMEKSDFEQASEWFERAAKYKPNAYFSPMYWEKAAIAYELLQEDEKARACYERIVNNYYKNALRPTAEKHIARLTHKKPAQAPTSKGAEVEITPAENDSLPERDSIDFP